MKIQCLKCKRIYEDKDIICIFRGSTIAGHTFWNYFCKSCYSQEEDCTIIKDREKLNKENYPRGYIMKNYHKRIMGFINRLEKYNKEYALKMKKKKEKP